VCSILLLGTFFHRFVKSYGGTSRAITAGTNTYATIQLFYLLAGLRSPDRLVLLRTSGFALGFLAKFLIVFGLIRLFASAAAFITNETARIHHTQRIIARIAHELNTPLSEISVHAVILRNEMRGRAHSALDSLENAVQRVAAIMDAATDWKLLDTARGTHSDASTVIRTPTVTRINKLVQTAVMAVKDTRDQTVHFVLSYSGNCCVLCIESEIVQVLINILRNSYDAFVSGKGKIHITTRVLAADAIKPERVQIVVVDNGHGISADVLPRVFLDGFSTRGHNGRGHGLAVVKNLTEANDGTVELTPISDASRGTTGVRAVLEFRRVKCDLTVRS
jgi:signal transduction histidine kinase